MNVKCNISGIFCLSPSPLLKMAVVNTNVNIFVTMYSNVDDMGEAGG